MESTTNMSGHTNPRGGGGIKKTALNNRYNDTSPLRWEKMLDNVTPRHRVDKGHTRHNEILK